MFCSNCGATLPEGAKFCANCGATLTSVPPNESAPAEVPSEPSPGAQETSYQAYQPYTPPNTYAPPSGEKVPDYLVFAILATILCCLPLGIPAIVYAVQAQRLAGEGRTQEALSKSKTAATWCWVALGAGLLSVVVTVVLSVLGAGLGFAAMDAFSSGYWY